MHATTLFIALLAGSSVVSSSPVAKKHKTKVTHKTVTSTDAASTTFDLGGIATSALVSGPMVQAAVTKRHEDRTRFREDRHHNSTRPEHHRGQGNESREDASNESAAQRRSMPIEVADSDASSVSNLSVTLNTTRDARIFRPSPTPAPIGNVGITSAPGSMATAAVEGTEDEQLPREAELGIYA